MRAAIARFIDEPDAAGDLGQRLERLYPEKMRELSDAMRATLVSQAATLARECRLDDRGVWPCAALSLLLGHGFYSDPQHPWAAAVLNRADESGRVSALAAASALHLRRWFDEET
jgi:hypothetical protein